MNDYFRYSFLVSTFSSARPTTFCKMYFSENPSSNQTVQLALDMLQQLYQPNQNLVFSPYSLFTALIMVLLGANGDSRAQLVKTLFGTSSGIRSQVIEFFDANQILLERNEATLRIANFLYAQHK